MQTAIIIHKLTKIFNTLLSILSKKAGDTIKNTKKHTNSHS